MRLPFYRTVGIWLACLLAAGVLLRVPSAVAQSETPAPEATAEPVTDLTLPGSVDDSQIPLVHQVQSGDNLTIIANTYGVTVRDILVVNGLTEADLLQIGQELIIPGGTGQVVPAVYAVRPGDTLRGIAGDFNTTPEEAAAANNTIQINPLLISGQETLVLSRTGSSTPRPQTGRPYLVQENDTLLTIAASHGISAAALTEANALEVTAILFPGQRLRIPDESVQYRDLPDGWVDVQARPLSPAQGDTLSIYVQNLNTAIPKGTLGGRELSFTPFGRGFLALIGLDALAETGLSELGVAVGRGLSEEHLPVLMPITATDYGLQQITVGEELSALLDPEVRSSEDVFLETIYGQYSDEQLWSGVFQVPITNTVVSAGYGSLRSYNGGPADIFHTGIDFAAPIGTEVGAPAAGTVVFSDEVDLRGLMVIIDHGLGVMTAFFHLSESFVEPGDKVESGQIVAAVGNSGLSSGPHLHWDLRINNVPVDPTQWTAQAFP